MRGARAGQYRNRLLVYNPPANETRDTFAQPTDVPVLIGRFFCKVEPLKGNELIAARQIKAQSQFKITLRWQGSSVPISPLSTFTLDGRPIGIVNANNVEQRNRRYELIGFEIQTGGDV